MPLKEIFNPIEQLCKKAAYRCRHAFVTAQFVCSFVPVCGKSSEKHQCRQQNRREQKNKTRYAAEKARPIIPSATASMSMSRESLSNP